MQQNTKQITADSCSLAFYFLTNYFLYRDFLITQSLVLNMYQALHKYLITDEI